LVGIAQTLHIVSICFIVDVPSTFIVKYGK